MTLEIFFQKSGYKRYPRLATLKTSYWVNVFVEAPEYGHDRDDLIAPKEAKFCTVTRSAKKGLAVTFLTQRQLFSKGALLMQNDHLWERGRISVILNLLIEVFPSTKYFTDVDHNKELTFGPLFQKQIFKSHSIHLQCCLEWGLKTCSWKFIQGSLVCGKWWNN